MKKTAIFKRYFFILSGLYFSFFSFGQDSIRQMNLREAINYAKFYNLQLKANTYNVKIQEAQIKTAGLRPNPVFNTQLLFLTDKTIYPDYPLWTSGMSRQDWFQLTKTFQLYGVRKEKITGETHLLDVVIAEYSIDRKSILKDVAISWLDTWYAQHNQLITQQSLSDLDSLFLKHNDAIDNVEEKIRLQILRDQYEVFYLDALQQQYQSIQKLKLLINNPFLEEVTYEDSTQLKDLDLVLDTLVQNAFINRSELQYQKAKANYYTSQYQLQKSLAIPSPEFGVIINPQNNIPYYGIFFTQPLPITDRNQGVIELTQHKYKQALEEYDITKLTIKNEVTIAYQQFKIQKEKMQKLENTIILSANLLSLIRKNYVQNQKGYLDIFEAERTWIETLKLFYKTEYDLKKAYIDLLYVSGYFDLL
jgi:cobalt-zinc-cadmium efflux system outer membrane protein